MSRLLPMLEVVLVEVDANTLTLAVREERTVRAVLKFKRSKKRLTLYVLTSKADPVKYPCSTRDQPPDCLDQAVAELSVQLGYPANSRDLYKAIAEAYSRWGDLVEVERLRALKSQLETRGEPLFTVEANGVLVEVLASDGVEMPGYGGFIDLGDCVGISETTHAYVKLASGEAGIDSRIETVGVLIVYEREGRTLSISDSLPFLPRIQGELEVCGRPVRLRKPAAKAVLGADTFPSAELLRDVAGARESLGLEEWRRVGRELVARLRESVYHRDPRVYAVLASYVAMTYFYDVFTAVPFLWFYGPPGSGKTRANMTVTFMSRRGVFIANPSSASLFRLADSLGGTIGVDESALTREQKLILASGYKRTAAVPRVEQTRSGFVLKLFSSAAPRVFSFIDLPGEDYLTQRIIAIPMEKGKPERSEDPMPGDYTGVRERLYRLRLLGLPAVIEAKERAGRVLERCGVEGRDREVWWPLVTAALLLGVERNVVEYMLEDLERKAESEEMYAAERTVLAAIEEFYSEPSDQSLDGDPVAVFTAKELQSIILMERLREEDCLEIVEGETGEKERVKPECRRRAEELRREWSPQRIGRILERMGLSRYKRVVGKSGKARRVYRLPRSVFEEKLRLYGAIGSVKSAESAKCLGEGTSLQGESPHPLSNGKDGPKDITRWLRPSNGTLPLGT